MGYTHYIKNKREFTDAEWDQFTKEVKEMLDKTNIPVANGCGDEGSDPIINDKGVYFNGVGDDAHETAFMPKGSASFDFCKTARKPYDKLVVNMYKIAERVLGFGITLSSDGGSRVFED